MKKLISIVAGLTLSLGAYADTLTPGGGTFNESAGNCQTIAYSHYVGWEPWAVVASSEILGKRAREQGVCVKVEMIPDYITSLEAFTNGTVQGVTVTNMDLLSFQSSTGSTEVIIAGDYSNGNDAILVRAQGQQVSMNSLKGKEVGIVELSVNDYLLDRCLEKTPGIDRGDIQVVNFTSEGDIAAQFSSQGGDDFVATVWNPVLMNLRSSVVDATTVCDSSEIPGEIIDLLAVDASLSSKHKQALVDAWYDTMALMSSRGKKGKDARTAMAENAENTLREYDRQLQTTAIWYTPQDAQAFLASQQLVTTTQSVYAFTRKQGIVADPQSIAIDGTVVVSDAGKKASINYVSTYTQNAVNRSK